MGICRALTPQARWRTASEWLALTLWILLIPHHAYAQGKPLVVVQLAPVAQLQQKAMHLAETCQLVQVAEWTRQALQAYAQGVDPQRPCLAVLQADARSFQVFVFVPVSDAATWLRSLPWAPALRDVGNGTMHVSFGRGRDLFLRSTGPWVILCNSADGYSQVPDPAQLAVTEGPPEDLALRIHLSHIPHEPRDAILQQLSGMAQFSAQQTMNSATPTQQKLRMESVQRGIAAFRQCFTEGESFAATASIDPQAERIVCNTTFVPIPGTVLQRKFTTSSQGRTRLNDFFIPNATIAMAVTNRLRPEDVQDLSQRLDLMKETLPDQIIGDGVGWDAEAKQILRSLIDDWVELVKASYQKGVVDYAASAMVQESGLTIIGGGQVLQQGDRAVRLLNQGTELAQRLKAPVQMKIDFHQQNGARFHAAQITLPAKVDLSRAFGPKLTLYVITSEEFIFWGVGSKSLHTLRKMSMDAIQAQAPKNAPPMRLQISTGPILKLAADTTRNQQLQLAAQRLRALPGRDQLSITQTITPKGVWNLRLEVQEGIIAGLNAAYAPDVTSRTAVR